MAIPKKKKIQNNNSALLSTVPLWDADTIAKFLMMQEDWQVIVAEPEDENKEIIYPTDPVEFMTKILGYRMWDKLEQICRSVENNHNTVVSSCFGSGKSVSAAALACWWLVTKKPSMVVTLAPTFSQVNSIIWQYIRSAAKRANLPGTVLETPRWKINEDQIAIGLSPRKSSDEDMASLAGRHSENLLVIMDEGSGLPLNVWQTVQGLAVGGNNRVLVISNPIEQSGPLWSAMNSPNWNPITISALEHPNVVTGNEIIPGAVTREWVNDRCNDWAYDVEPNTVDSVHIPWNNRCVKPLPIFKAKVLGEAPELSEDQLISLSWVKQAQESEGQTGSVIVGLDPARSGGDDSALCVRQGMQVLFIHRRKNQDSNKLAAWLNEICEQYPVEKIYIDEIGIGAGALDAARKLGLPVTGVAFSRASSMKNRFVNQRAQCWWNLRESLRLNKLGLPPDPQLEGDLVVVKYNYDNYGRILLESKEDLRKRLGRSPDSGDALALTFSVPWQDEDFMSAKTNQNLSGEGDWTGSRWIVENGKKLGGSRWRK